MGPLRSMYLFCVGTMGPHIRARGMNDATCSFYMCSVGIKGCDSDESKVEFSSCVVHYVLPSGGRTRRLARARFRQLVLIVFCVGSRYIFCVGTMGPPQLNLLHVVK